MKKFIEFLKTWYPVMILWILIYFPYVSFAESTCKIKKFDFSQGFLNNLGLDRTPEMNYDCFKIFGSA